MKRASCVKPSLSLLSLSLSPVLVLVQYNSLFQRRGKNEEIADVPSRCDVTYVVEAGCLEHLVEKSQSTKFLPSCSLFPAVATLISL